jgi:hypothetical protein
MNRWTPRAEAPTVEMRSKSRRDSRVEALGLLAIPGFSCAKV